MSYKSVYEAWKKNPTEFWKNQSKEISWYEPADKILDDSRKPFYNWFTGGSIMLVIIVLTDTLKMEEGKISLSFMIAPCVKK